MRSYDALKEAVIFRNAPTEDKRIRQISRGIELGNEKPSELLWEVRRLSCATFGDDPMPTELRLQRIPPHLPPLLSAARNYSLEETAEIPGDTMSRYSPGVSAP